MLKSNYIDITGSIRDINARTYVLGFNTLYVKKTKRRFFFKEIECITTESEKDSLIDSDFVKIHITAFRTSKKQEFKVFANFIKVIPYN